MDPLGNIPFFLHRPSKDLPRKYAFRVSLATFLILLFFAFVGEWILRLLRVTISSFQIAGGILIFIIAISMLQARRSRARSTPEEEHDRQEGEDVSIFPLAIPMMSGPAAITTVMVLISISKSYAQKGLVLLAILLTTLACYWILGSSGCLLKILRRTGLNVLSRLMGLLLAVIAVQFVVDGIKAVLIQIVPPKETSPRVIFRTPPFASSLPAARPALSSRDPQIPKIGRRLLDKVGRDSYLSIKALRRKEIKT